MVIFKVCSQIYSYSNKPVITKTRQGSTFPVLLCYIHPLPQLVNTSCNFKVISDYPETLKTRCWSTLRNVLTVAWHNVTLPYLCAIPETLLATELWRCTTSLSPLFPSVTGTSTLRPQAPRAP